MADRPVRPATHRLLLDVMLGKLAVYLRICGYDSAYAGDRGIEDDDEIVALAVEEERTLLTRDVKLAERADEAILLTQLEVEDQLAELHEAGFDLVAADEPSNCGRCNGDLIPADPDAETPAYAPEPSEFACWRCRSCGQLFWKGTHYERMKETLETID